MPHTITHEEEITQPVTTPSGAQVDPITGALLEAPPAPEFELPDFIDTSIEDLDIPELAEIETPQADVVDDFSTRFADIQKALLPQAEFEQQKREEFGISETRTAQEDLVSQIRGFQIESKRLANQKALAAERIQQQSIGRGRTVGGVAPLTAAAQRRITLQQADIASQSLTALAALNAVQGKLVTANRLVEESVQKKFSALLAEKASILENIKFLQDSGILTREENKRAEATKARTKREEDIIKQQQDKELAIQQFGLSVAPALSEVEGGQTILDSIFKAESIEQAIQLATKAGAFESEVDDLREQLLRTQLATANLEFTETQKAANDATSPGILEALSKDQQTAYFKIVDDYDGASKDFFKVRDAFNRVVTSAEDPSAAGDLALIFNFMKTLDPGSVVRESEFATAAQAGSFLDRTYGFGLRLKEGQRLAPDQRQDFLDRSIKLFETAQQQQRVVNNTFIGRAEDFGIPGDRVVMSIDSVKRESTSEGISVGEIEEIDEILGANNLRSLFESLNQTQ